MSVITPPDRAPRFTTQQGLGELNDQRKSRNRNAVAKALKLERHFRFWHNSDMALCPT